jgi:hypothetical protein
VSYRIGEKGSVKILFSENDSNNYAAQNGLLTTVTASRAEPAAPPCQVPSPTCLTGSNGVEDLSPEISSISPGVDPIKPFFILRH